MLKHRSVLIAAGLLALFVFRTSAGSAETAPPSPHIPAAYTLVWNDEFTGDKLVRTRWRVRYPGPREAGFISADAVTLDGEGHLLLSTREQDGKLLNGMIGTDSTFKRAFGYYEARLKFEQQRGHHGCFWLQSNAPRVPGDARASGVEVDIAEFFGPGRKDSGLGVNVYWTAADGKVKREGGIVKLDAILGDHAKATATIADDFHIYGFLWTPDEYVITIDGHEVFRTREGVSHQPAYIVLSLLTANWEVAWLDRKKLPDALTVDYVRVYAPDK